MTVLDHLPEDFTIPFSTHDLYGRFILSVNSRRMFDAVLDDEVRAELQTKIEALKQDFVLPAGTALARAYRYRDANNQQFPSFMNDDTVRNLVNLVSGGTLELTDEVRGYGHAAIRHVRPLTREAFGLWTTVTNLYAETDDEGANQYATAAVFDTLDTFAAFESRRVEFLRRVMRERLGTSVNESRNNAKPVRSGTGNFSVFYRKARATVESAAVATPYGPVLQDIALLPNGTLSSRRWGIEIEAVDIAGISTPEGWSLKDDGSLRSMSESDHDTDCEYWDDHDIDYCNCGAYGDATETGEWVSPILRSFHSRGLKHLGDELVNRQSNYSAGVHVHVEASDLTPAQAARVQLIYSLFEPLFEHEYQREEREYCRPVSTDQLMQTLRYGRELRQQGRASTQFPYMERYLTVNLNALSAHGTIEFRAMGPRYDYDTLVRWAHFCREMVNLAASRVTQREYLAVRSFRDIIELFAKYGKETATPEWVVKSGTEPVAIALPTERRRRPNVSVNEDVMDDYVGALQINDRPRFW